MKYQGVVKGVGDVNYRVVINDNDVTDVSTKSIDIGADGLIVYMDGDDNVFKPIKSGGATITVSVNDYMFNLYSSKSNGAIVTIHEQRGGGSWEPYWVGRVTPNCYNQDWRVRDVDIEIEAVDCLGTLGDKKVSPINVSGLTSVMDYLRRAVYIACGEGIHMGLYVVEPFSDVTLSEIVVQESNWVDEGGEWCSWKELLESILTPLKLCIQQRRGYGMMVCDAEQYRCAEWKIDGNVVGMPLQRIEDVDMLSTPTLSLTECYKKIRVNVSLYSQNSLLPDIWGDGLRSYGTGVYSEHPSIDEDHCSDCYYTFLGNKYFVPYYYNRVNFSPLFYAPEDIGVGVLQNDVGAVMCKMRVDTWTGSRGDSVNRLVNNIGAKECIIIGCHNYDNLIPHDEKLMALPMFKIVGANSVVFGDGYGVLISGGVNYSNLVHPYYNKERGDAPGGGLDYELCLICKLRIGDKYMCWSPLNNSSPHRGQKLWSTSEATFKLYIDKDVPVRKGDGVIDGVLNDDFIIRNNVDWQSGIKGKGFYVPITGADALAGDIEFTVYGVGSLLFTGLSYVFLNDFKISIERVTGVMVGDGNQDDIEYSNVIDANNVGDDTEIKLKIATDVGRDFSRASLLRRGADGSLTYLKEVTNALTKERGIVEHHLIDAYCREYKRPRKVISGTVVGADVDVLRGWWSDEWGCAMMVRNIKRHLEIGEIDVDFEEL